VVPHDDDDDDYDDTTGLTKPPTVTLRCTLGIVLRLTNSKLRTLPLRNDEQKMRRYPTGFEPCPAGPEHCIGLL
jgi:hypothetical protein